MARYHVNLEGNPGRCRAATGRCPFGGENEHFDSKAEARKAYESQSFPEPGLNDVATKYFAASAQQAFGHAIRMLDANDGSFAVNASGADVNRAMYLSGKLPERAQTKIDEQIAGWYDNQKDLILEAQRLVSDAKYADETKVELERAWSDKVADLRDSFSLEMDDSIKGNASLKAYVERSPEGYRAFSRAVVAADETADYGRFNRSWVDRAGFYSFKPSLRNYDEDELLKTASVAPYAATVLAQRERAASVHLVKAYEAVAEPVKPFALKLQDQRRDALQAVLSRAELNLNEPKGIFVRASKAINTPDGLEAKTFAKIVNGKMKSAEVITPDARMNARTIVENVRAAL